jgi:hypothetical protein
MKRSVIICAALLLMASPAIAAPNGVYTPKQGSAERTSILDPLRSDSFVGMKFTVDTMRVFHGRKGAIAYVIAVPSRREFDGGTYILTKIGRGPWKMVWADTGGGSDSCAKGARHYRWASNLFSSFGAAPEQMIPGVGAQIREFEKKAQTDPDFQCTGDLEGGPE